MCKLSSTATTTTTTTTSNCYVLVLLFPHFFKFCCSVESAKELDIRKIIKGKKKESANASRTLFAFFFAWFILPINFMTAVIGRESNFFFYIAFYNLADRLLFYPVLLV